MNWVLHGWLMDEWSVARMAYRGFGFCVDGLLVIQVLRRGARAERSDSFRGWLGGARVPQSKKRANIRHFRIFIKKIVLLLTIIILIEGKIRGVQMSQSKKRANIRHFRIFIKKIVLLLTITIAVEGKTADPEAIFESLICKP